MVLIVKEKRKDKSFFSEIPSWWSSLKALNLLKIETAKPLIILFPSPLAKEE